MYYYYSFIALTVRYLTKRYIGEYDHQSGKYSSLKVLITSFFYLKFQDKTNREFSIENTSYCL